MAKTRDMWDTWSFDDVNLDYKLNAPIFKPKDAVCQHLQASNPTEQSSL